MSDRSPLALRVQQIRELLSNKQLEKGFVVIAADRRYRQDYVDVVFSEMPVTTIRIKHPDDVLLGELVEQYHRFGLLADPGLMKDKKHLASLRGEAIAVAVCRILNDFRPFDKIVDSLWSESKQEHRMLYLVCALAQRCHQTGLRYSVLQAIAGPLQSVDELMRANLPLSLAANSLDEDFVVPQSAVVADRLLTAIAKIDRDLLLEAFVSLANHIAPRVNRKSIMLQSPEARLAGRLFDADKIVRPLLADDAEGFYVAVKSTWEWNSRYWEQRALLVMDRDIRTAIQYARHAVATEKHPYTLTTLGKVLFRNLDSIADREARAKVFEEAFGVLNQAIDMEAQNSRVTIHPFSTLIVGAAKFLEQGGSVTLSQSDTLSRHLMEARYRFDGDTGVAEAIARLDGLI